MKKTKLMATILSIMLCMSTFTFTVNAQDISVKVQIAPFYTEIDYVSVDNRYVEYPLITYKDITYFPMTFDLCAQLGLVCGFDSEKGLFITRAPINYYSEDARPFGGDKLNSYGTLYDAVIPSYPVCLNGIYIDNEKEEYPLINFRGVTYFPMTWRFAYEELNFDIEWSQENYSFKLTNDNGFSSAPYPRSIEGNTVKLQEQKSVYSETPSEYGGTRYTLLYNCYAHYDFDTASQTLIREADTEKGYETNMPERTDKLTFSVKEAIVKDKSIYIENELLISLDKEESVNGASVREFKTGDSSLIFLSAQIGEAPAPYTTYKKYFFVKDSSGIKQIPWDEKSNFDAIYPDNKGGFYITTHSYSPVYSGRWSNSFSDIYYYTPGMEFFECVTEKHSDLFNSMYALGAEDGKLYFLGMWYDSEKDSYNQNPHFSSVNSGYYTLDLETGELTKLYPYIYGTTFFGPDKNLYCISTSSRTARIVNLNTGKIIPVE